MSLSIRRRLVLAVVGLTAPVVALGAFVLYSRVAATVRDGFDRDLEASARLLADLCERDEEGYELDPRAARILSSSDPLYLQVWLPDGTVLHRSEPLADGELPRPGPGDGSAGLESVTLADGTALRVARYRFVPRSELPGEQPPIGLSVGRSTARTEAMLSRLRLTFAGVAGLLVVLSALLVGRGIAIGLRPLDRLGREIEGLDSSIVDGRVSGEGAPAELRPLTDELNRLLARHQEAFVRERRFTADAAHELRTPLSVLQTEIEVALRRDRDAVDYRAVLGGALETTAEMTRCVDALLMIARADADRLAVRREPVELPALVRDCWRGEARVAGERDVTLELASDGAGEVDTDPALMRLIVGNLLSNAVRHGAAGGPVVVAVQPAPGVVLRVGNRAPALEPADLPHLFERFWRRDAARTDTAAHSGLGLALVDSLATRLGLRAVAALDDHQLTISLVDERAEKGEPV